MTALAAEAPPVDLNAARTCVVQLDLATRLVRRSADDVSATQAPGWWGPASTGYATARTDAARSLHDTTIVAADLAAAIDRYVIDATVALRRWEDAQDDLRRARDAAPVVLAGGVLDPRPAAHAEAEAAARVRAAETELHGAATALVTAASAAIDRLVPPPVDPVRSSIDRWSWLSGLEVDDPLPPPQGAPAVDPNLMQRAMARGMVEAGVDMMRTVPDLLVMLANHSLGPTSSYRFPSVRFTFEDDLSRAMDEVTGPCTWDTNPLCSSYKWGGYGTATIGTAFIPGAGAEAVGTKAATAAAGVGEVPRAAPLAVRTWARADGHKFRYLFGRVSSNEHNFDRSAQLRAEFSRLGIRDDAVGRAILYDHFDVVVANDDNIIDTWFTTWGKFEKRESLLVAPGGFRRLETTWLFVGSDRRLITVIPTGSKG